MSEDKENIFKRLSSINLDEKVKEKNGLKYLSWASAWSAFKAACPSGTFTIYPQNMDDKGNTRPWHDDGKTGWVEVGVEADGEQIIETLAIMDHRNNAIPADQITSVQANKAVKRCLVKAIGMFCGLGLYIYEGEDMPDSISKAMEMQSEIIDLVKKKCALSPEAKTKVETLCKNAEKEANPDFEDNEITGNPRNIDDADILEKLKRQIMAVRK